MTKQLRVDPNEALAGDTKTVRMTRSSCGGHEHLVMPETKGTTAIRNVYWCKTCSKHFADEWERR